MYLDYFRELNLNSNYSSNRLLGSKGRLKHYIMTGNYGDRFSRRYPFSQNAAKHNRIIDALKGGAVASIIFIIAGLVKKRKLNTAAVSELKDKVLDNVGQNGNVVSDAVASGKASLFTKFKNLFAKFSANKGAGQ